MADTVLAVEEGSVLAEDIVPAGGTAGAGTVPGEDIGLAGDIAEEDTVPVVGTVGEGIVPEQAVLAEGIGLGEAGSSPAAEEEERRKADSGEDVVPAAHRQDSDGIQGASNNSG